MQTGPRHTHPAPPPPPKLKNGRQYIFPREGGALGKEVPSACLASAVHWQPGPLQHSPSSNLRFGVSLLPPSNKLNLPLVIFPWSLG